MGLVTQWTGETCGGSQQEGRRDVVCVIQSPVCCPGPTGLGGAGRQGGGSLRLASDSSSGKKKKSSH